MPIVGGNYPTVGALWNAVWTDIASYSGSSTLARFASSIQVPTGSGPGGLSVVVTQGDVVTSGFYGLSSWVVGHLPWNLGSLLRSAGFSDPISLLPSTGPNSPEVLVPVMFTAHDQLIQTAPLINPYLIVQKGISYLPSVNNLVTAVFTKLTSWVGPSDSGTSVLVVQNQGALTAPTTPLPPAGQSFARNQSVIPPIQVTVIIPQFQDVSFRNGQAVFSVETNSTISTNGVK